MPTLVFVYNADSGLFNLVTDFAHKLLSPNTYSCNLCKITYSQFAMKKQWKSFVESLPYECEFLHRDELYEKYGEKQQVLPALFIKTDQGLKLAISSEEINRCEDIDSLKELVSDKLKSFV